MGRYFKYFPAHLLKKENIFFHALMIHTKRFAKPLRPPMFRKRFLSKYYENVSESLIKLASFMISIVNDNFVLSVITLHFLMTPTEY